jgi:tRNA A-37 threonylcarbamoyl transferase component Bud32
MSDDELQLRAQGRVGTVLCGKYRIDGVLGVGGMAVVYAATHRNQKRVAIKMLHPELSMRQEIRARFFREGYAANTVDHPGAVAVLDDDVAEDGAAFLVMEQLEGDELERIWEKHGGRLEARVVLAVADPLLAVLAAAHAKAIVHRDIKPANLYVTRDGSLKVLDFGIARVRDAASGSDSATKTGLMLGTPAYMAPEQALGKSKEIDGKTDLWSVGATLFTLLSGLQVHEGESATAILVQAATQPARPLGSVAPGVDPRLAAIVDRALAFDRDARWPDAASMRAAVRAAHLEMFGAPVSKDALALLFGAEGEASTMLAFPAAAPTPPPVTVPPAVARAVSIVTEPGALRGYAPQAPQAYAPAASPSHPPGASQSYPPAAAPGYAPAAPQSYPPAAAPGYAPAASQSYPPAAAQGYAPAASVPVRPAQPGQLPPGPALPAMGHPTQVPTQDDRRLPGILAGLAVVACAAIGAVAWRMSSDAATAPEPPPTASAVTTSSAAPPRVEPADASDAPDAAETADAADAPTSSTSRPLLPSTSRPAPHPVPQTTSTPTPAPAPVPAPVPTPAAPPPVCRTQCADVARGCKARCKGQLRFGRERHQCLVDCETVERDCKSRAPC